MAGKELVARTLHTFSGRPGPLVVFDASVADPEMVRNDLFGHIKGAFTGATGTREGAFRQAHTGTLFIDEIGELPLDLQPRLLRVLETREVMPIGSDNRSGRCAGQYSDYRDPDADGQGWDLPG
ncbi:MAG: sigma 54-interacting transcriptional regulator [Candidatus Competibacteraceae bacterium]